MSTSTPSSRSSPQPAGWDGLWLTMATMDRDRFIVRGPGRTRVERVGTEVAVAALGASSADDPTVQELITQLAPLMPHLPLDRFGFTLGAAVAMAGRDDAAKQLGPALERLGAELTEANRRTAEASFAAAQRETQRQADQARANEPVDEVTQCYRALVMTLAELAGGRTSVPFFDGDEGRHLETIATRLAEHQEANRGLMQERDDARRLMRAAQREKDQLAGEVLRLKEQLASRRRPDPVLLRSWQEAERHAAAWMRYLGYPDAAVTPPGPDGGLDVVAEHAIAQVKAEGHLTGSAVVRQLAGITVGGTHQGKTTVFFSTFGYSRDAVATAEEIGVALFRFGEDGDAVAESSAAARLLEAAGGPVSAPR